MCMKTMTVAEFTELHEALAKRAASLRYYGRPDMAAPIEGMRRDLLSIDPARRNEKSAAKCIAAAQQALRTA